MSRSQLLLSWFRYLGHAVVIVAALVRLLAVVKPSVRDWLQARFSYRSLDVPLGLTLALIFVVNFVVGLFYVPTRSMLPTLQIRDGIAVNLLSYRFRQPKLNEIVVFRRPDGQFLVKRIVGLGGDSLRIDSGVLFRNDQPQPEFACGPQESMPPHQVAPDSVFVMGDNRTNSMDSRVFGDVHLAELQGSVVFRYWPLGRLGSP